ncbi:hypothetical protein BC567DRAFT_216818 [Phyllosticta citribraziliensis]
MSLAPPALEPPHQRTASQTHSVLTIHDADIDAGNTNPSAANRRISFQHSKSTNAAKLLQRLVKDLYYSLHGPAEEDCHTALTAGSRSSASSSSDCCAHQGPVCQTPASASSAMAAHPAPTTCTARPPLPPSALQQQQSQAPPASPPSPPRARRQDLVRAARPAAYASWPWGRLAV